MSEKLGFFILKSDKLKKDIAGLWPCVDIAAALVCAGERVLAVYNEKWGAFTLPMSKRRKWKDAKVDGSERTEEWDEAAVRAAAEWLGRTIPEQPEFLFDFAEFQQSDRDEKWKRYHMQAFKIDVGADARLPAARITEWLTGDELIDEARRPISPTARHIIHELKLNGLI